ncbi:glucose-6-phosphate isomerase [Rubrobacter taiwanensis]|jgi:glucose-6-phosphate isomerase|uniref:Glucose-6-phosphate isomerase n=1 Tax=Rubrobacter taiwanensis TaxID=185139 RepID=A0A4R1BDT8_9ACTN|nr:glucose-6-phosphate isomerase [Rubrobacter taiwanensis]TCJ15251.1 glucose-6-phosphate isomerase [Rubrobacter taiwanensis]
MVRVSFDYTNLLEVEGGIRESELSDLRPRLERATDEHLQDPPGFTRLPHTRDLLTPSKALAEEIRTSGATDFVHVGIGGSSLGPVALHRALNHPYYNALAERGGPRMHFAENPDPNTLHAILDLVELESTWINVVTKSGSTAETMANFLVLRRALVEASGEAGYRERTIFTTDPDSGYLREIAEREKIRTLPIPQDVGGRYSVLTPVGLLPAAVSGLDAEALLSGAASCANEIAERRAEHPAVLGAAMHYLMDTSRGRNIRVMMPYADALERFAAWFVQLWAESLGKEGKGSTPLGAVGTTDQHSQLQLYMEGPQDKVIELIEVENHPNDLEIPRAYEDLEGVGYLGGHTVAELLNVECDATRRSLAEAGRPNCTIRLGTVDEAHLGYLIYALEAQTAIAGGLYGVNPFDQPGVEAGKRITYSRMGRPGY